MPEDAAGAGAVINLRHVDVDKKGQVHTVHARPFGSWLTVAEEEEGEEEAEGHVEGVTSFILGGTPSGRPLALLASIWRPHVRNTRGTMCNHPRRHPSGRRTRFAG